MCVHPLTLAEVNCLKRLKMDWRFSDEEQVFAALGVGNATHYDRRCRDTRHEQNVQSFDLVECIEPRVLR